MPVTAPAKCEGRPSSASARTAFAARSSEREAEARSGRKVSSPDGSMRDVGSLPSGSGSWLHGVNDAGVAVGFGLVPAYAPKGYLTNTWRGEPFTNGRWLGGDLDPSS
jgi:hypothetical protein